MFKTLVNWTMFVSVVLVVIACFPQGRAFIVDDAYPAVKNGVVAVGNLLRRTKTNTEYDNKVRELNRRRENLETDRLVGTANLAKVTGKVREAMKTDYEASWAEQEAMIKLTESELSALAVEKMAQLDKDDADLRRTFVDQKREIVNDKAAVLVDYQDLQAKRAQDSAQATAQAESERLSASLSALALKLADLNTANDALEEATRCKKPFPIKVGKKVFGSSEDVRAVQVQIRSDLAQAKKEYDDLKRRAESERADSARNDKPGRVDPRDLLGN